MVDPTPYEAAWYRDADGTPAERIGVSFIVHDGDMLSVPDSFEFAWLAVVDIDSRIAMHIICGELHDQRLTWQWSYLTHFTYLGPRNQVWYAWTSL